MTTIKTILVPVDFSPQSERALAFAIDLARPLGASVQLVAAYQLPLVGLPEGVYAASAEIAARLSETTQASLDRVYDAHRDAGVPIHKRITVGDAREAILATAKDVHADLIVMGTHGRRGLSRALIGSVAEAVVRMAEVPVVTVH